MTINERIRYLRKENGMSQGELAKSLGISRQAVSKWENSSSVPDMENMLALAEVFGTELEYIASGTVAQVEAPPPPLLPSS